MTAALFIVSIAAILTVGVWFLRAGQTYARSNPSGEIVTISLRGGWEPDYTGASIAIKHPDEGASLQITVLPMEVAPMYEANLEKLVAATARAEERSSVEKSVEVKLIDQHGVRGFVYSCTDRHVKPGSWAHKTAGLFIAGGRVVQFTLLSHLGPPAGVAKGMKALSTLKIAQST